MSLTVTQRPSIGSGESYTYNQINFDAAKAQLQFNGVDLTTVFEVGDSVFFESTSPGYGVAADVLTSVFSSGNTLVTLDHPYYHPVGGYAYNITKGAFVSRWNAVRNPVVYKMQRSDFTFDQVNNNTGNIQLQFNAVDISASFTVGDSVYIQSDNGVYDLSGVVTAKSFSTNTLITINQAYVSAAPGGFLNNFTTRLNYRVQIEVYNGAGVLLPEMLVKAPSQKGALLIDVSSILKANLIADLDADLTGTTEVFDDTNAYIQFYIKYREVWTGSAESQTSDVANKFFASLSARQIPAPNGGNMAEYAYGEIKFLTKLTTPVMWRGYPFLLSAIIKEDIASDVFLDTGVDASTPDDYSGKLIHFDLNQIITDQSINETDVAIFESTSGPPQLSETLPIELREACENPILLVGRNSLGGILTWMFDDNQDYSFVNQDTKNKRMRLIADDLTINQWEALQDFFGLGEVYRNNILELTSSTIKTSSRIGSQVYAVDADGNKIGVIVVPREPQTETRQKRHSFEIDIDYPEIFA